MRLIAISTIIREFVVATSLMSVFAPAAMGMGAYEGKACVYFTRDTVEHEAGSEHEPGVTRLNRYVAGSTVCFEGEMYLCRSTNRWKSMGPCDAYQRADEHQACRLEQGRDDCDRQSNDSSQGERNQGGQNRQDSQAGNGAGSGGSGGPDLPEIEVSAPSFPDPFTESREGAGAPLSSADGAFGGSGPDAGTSHSGSGNWPDGNQSGSGGQCEAEFQKFSRDLQEAMRAMNSERSALRRRLQGICGIARYVKDFSLRLRDFYQRCPTTDPTGEMTRYTRDLHQWGLDAERQACTSGTASGFNW